MQTAKAGKSSGDTLKDKPETSKLSSSFADPGKVVEEILERMSAIVLSEINEENIKQHGEQLGALVSNSVRKHLSLDLTNLTTMLKNTAYTEGFHAGTHQKGFRCP